MKSSRLTFSIRSLLACIACIALLLALGIRFGAHALWYVTGVQRPTITAVPLTPLVVEPIAEETTSVIIGPYSLRLPASMCQSFEVKRPTGFGVVLLFTDNTRKAIIHLSPSHNARFFPMADFPSKAGLTDFQIYKEIVSANSTDFSFGMSTEQLRWHKWLVTNRKFFPNVEPIKFVETRELEAKLLRLSSNHSSFEWETTNGEWKGVLRFIDPTGDPGWIRYVASTFELRGDPSVFSHATDAELKAMVSLSQDASPPRN
jgi:hypothetical protein